MARYTDAVCKLCRREGKKLFLKGDKCYTNKCALDKRSYAPGQHGQSRKKLSNYGMQLRAKQTARRYYGLNESQFYKYFLMAQKKAGVTGDNLLIICESRLDNVVYTCGFASSRAEARQLVSHAHFLVNGKKVNIPSYLCKAGDVISIKKKSMDSEKFKTLLSSDVHTIPAWVSVNKEAGEATLAQLPERDQITAPVDEQLIVELYSK